MPLFYCLKYGQDSFGGTRCAAGLPAFWFLVRNSCSHRNPVLHDRQLMEVFYAFEPAQIMEDLYVVGVFAQADPECGANQI